MKLVIATLILCVALQGHGALIRGRGVGRLSTEEKMRKLEVFTPCPGSHPCNSRQDCTQGACVCKAGYTGPNCHGDLDECSELEPCSFPGGACVNHFASDGRYSCVCKVGWLDGTMGEHGVESCQEVDECLENPCHADAVCMNQQPGYTCVCTEGLVGDGVTACDPPAVEVVVDPCDNKGCDSANSLCELDASGDPICLCLPGFSQIRPDSECTDVRECDDETICPPNAFCQEQDGGFECLCKST